MMLEQIEKRQEALQREIAAKGGAVLVTCGVKLPMALRDRLSALKDHYKVKSISEVVVRILDKHIAAEELNAGIRKFEERSGF